MSDLKKIIPSTVSQSSDKPSNEITPISKPISVSLSEHLFKLAKQVTNENVTPSTVSAACKCAAEIHKLLKFQWEIKKSG